MPSIYILGINAYHGDVSAVLLRDGELVAALEEERFTRVKHAAGFPTNAIRACLDTAGIAGADVAHVAVSRDPRAHLARKAAYVMTRRPAAGLVTDRLRNRRLVSDLRGPLAIVVGSAVHGGRWLEDATAYLDRHHETLAAKHPEILDTIRESKALGDDVKGDLIRAIEGMGCVLVRHGGKHDWYSNPNTGVSQPVPRHREIKEHLARQILRMLGPTVRR